MSVIPGSSSKLNTVRGVSAMLVTTAAEEISLATKVLPAQYCTWRFSNVGNNCC